MRGARLSVARLCAVQHRYEEAASWLNKAREALDEQGARPLRAIADLMRGSCIAAAMEQVTSPRANLFLDAALKQFCTLERGWLGQAELALSRGSN